MRISKMKIENFIGIKNEVIDLSKVNYIVGQSGSGKTSIVEAIEKAFTNKNRRTEVVKRGETEATIFIETDNDLEITRKIRTEKSDYLKVTKDGENKSTEKFLKGFVNGQIFRPLDWVNLTPKQQADTILTMLEYEWTIEDIKKWFGEIVDVDYNKHILLVLKDIENKYFKDREDINRKIKQLKGFVEASKKDLPTGYDVEMWRNAEAKELYKKMEEANKVNTLIAKAKMLIDNFEAQVNQIDLSCTNEVEALKNKVDSENNNLELNIRMYKEKIEEAERVIRENNESLASMAIKIKNSKEEEKQKAAGRIENAKKYINENEKVNIEEIQQEIQQLENMKSYVRVCDKINSELVELEELEKASKDLTNKVEIAREIPSKIIASSGEIIKGLSVDSEGNVRINGILVSGLSDGEKLNLALTIAKEQCGELKLICLDRFESLNPSVRMDLVREMLKDDFQYLITSTEKDEFEILAFDNEEDVNEYFNIK